MDTLLNRPNKDRTFCSSIKTSSYEQGTNKFEKELYSTLIELFLSCYDPAYSILDDKDKGLYILQKVTQISSFIDEKKDSHYDKYKYSKKFKSSLIQTGLQIDDSISSLLYFNDLFSVQTVVIDMTAKRYIITTDKRYKQYYITKKDDKWIHIDGIPAEATFNEGDFSDLESFFVMDFTSKNIHKPYLNGIGTYKVQDLQKMAKGMDICLEDNGKKKTKKRLYDNINMYQLNLL